MRDSHLKVNLDWNNFVKLLDDKNIILSPFCGEPHCEEKIKADSTREEPAEAGTSAMGAKTLCIPLEQVRERVSKSQGSLEKNRILGRNRKNSNFQDKIGTNTQGVGSFASFTPLTYFFFSPKKSSTCASILNAKPQRSSLHSLDEVIETTPKKCIKKAHNLFC